MNDLLHTANLTQLTQAEAAHRYTLLTEAELAFQADRNPVTAQALIAAQLAHLTSLENMRAVGGMHEEK